PKLVSTFAASGASTNEDQQGAIQVLNVQQVLAEHLDPLGQSAEQLGLELQLTTNFLQTDPGKHVHATP
ncbi:529_t:CDS:2, partial [Cetraspora pellucida]